MNDQEKHHTQELMEALRRFRKVHWHPHVALGGHLNSSEFFVLHKIAIYAKTNPAHTISPSDISRDLHVSSPTVTQHITSLEAKGFVLREMDKSDRRKIQITLTPEGMSCLKDAKQSMLKTFDGLADYLGGDETEQFIKLLTNSTDYFREQDLMGNDPCCKNFHNGDLK
jgi:DNA-binding MarR family transcriptional regulator